MSPKVVITQREEEEQDWSMISKRISREELSRFQNTLRYDPPLSLSQCQALIDHADATIDDPHPVDAVRAQIELGKHQPSRAEIAMHIMAAEWDDPLSVATLAIKSVAAADALLAELAKE